MCYIVSVSNELLCQCQLILQLSNAALQLLLQVLAHIEALKETAT